MNILKISILSFLFLVLSFKGFSQDDDKQYMAVCVGFYNLENLFDTIVDPDTNKILQEDFTPIGYKNWNTPKYYEKLDHLSEVISQLGTDVNPDGPAVLGVSEIENREVLEDLVATEKLKGRNYEIVHYHSPDRRGIDVALLYQPKYFEVTNSINVPLRIEGKDDFYTRDQLVVTGKLNGEKVSFIVAHWPSRRGGEKKSAPLRYAAGELGKHIIDSLQNIDSEAKVIYMGDLNDDPINKSLKNAMRGKRYKDEVGKNDLFNPMYDFYKKGVGTLAYRDNWNLFDQMLLTPSFLTDGYESFKFYNAKVFNKQFLMQQDGKYKGYPWRSYGGPEYIGGYSDHFPVYLFLVKEANTETTNN